MRWLRENWPEIPGYTYVAALAVAAVAGLGVAAYATVNGHHWLYLLPLVVLIAVPVVIWRSGD